MLSLMDWAAPQYLLKMEPGGLHSSEDLEGYCRPTGGKELNMLWLANLLGKKERALSTFTEGREKICWDKGTKADVTVLINIE